ncbi:RNA polymerase sigma factor [Streptomyces mirabilis]
MTDDLAEPVGRLSLRSHTRRVGGSARDVIVATETTGVERTGPVVELSLRDRIRAGDPDAFAELFGAHARAVYGHAARLSADRGTAEDVVSLTFLEAWRLREKLRPEAAAPDEGRRALSRGREDSGRLGRHRRQGLHRPLRHRPEFQGARRPHGLGLRQEVPRLPGLGGRGAAGCRGRGQGRRDAGPMMACPGEQSPLAREPGWTTNKPQAGQVGPSGLREKAVSPAVATIASLTSSTRGG